MIDLIRSIVNKDYVKADSLISETVELIMAKKLHEAKKKTASKMCEQGLDKSAAELTRRDVVEQEAEDDEDYLDIKYGPKVSVNGGPALRSNERSPEQNAELNKIKQSAKSSMSGQSSSTQSTSSQSPSSSKIKMVPVDSYSNTKGIENFEEEKIQYQNSGAGAMKDPTHRPYNAKESPTKGPYNLMNRSIEYANKYSPKSNLKEETEEQLDEARVKIIKARIRGGKIQRRKKISNVPGMTLRSGKLKRMTPAERRNRKMGQRRGKIKRRSKMNRAIMKRQRSLRKRKALGL